jgi:hypothetical protein
MMRCCCPAAIFMALIAIFCSELPVAAQQKKPSPEAAIAGTWRAEVSDAHSLLLDIRGSSVELKLVADGAVTSLWAGKLSFPKEHSDRHFDWVEIKAGDRALPDNKCLYRLAGDTLLVIGGGSAERPTRFVSGPGAEPRTLIFTRSARGVE